MVCSSLLFGGATQRHCQGLVANSNVQWSATVLWLSFCGSLFTCLSVGVQAVITVWPAVCSERMDTGTSPTPRLFQSAHSGLHGDDLHSVHGTLPVDTSFGDSDPISKSLPL